VVLEILTYPNRVLKKRSKEVGVFDEELHKLLDDMNDTMILKKGIGLAAVQVGVLKRVFILNIPDENGEQHPENLIEVINPEILASDGEIVYEEGCLSIPQYYENVKRAETISVRFQNRNGETIEKILSDLDAIAFQHEFDHLDGHLFIERIGYMKRKKFEKEWKKNRK